MHLGKLSLHITGLIGMNTLGKRHPRRCSLGNALSVRGNGSDTGRLGSDAGCGDDGNGGGGCDSRSDATS
eukprot:462208-Karenia_brevis.AAC.1